MIDWGPLPEKDAKAVRRRRSMAKAYAEHAESVERADPDCYRDYVLVLRAKAGNNALWADLIEARLL